MVTCKKRNTSFLCDIFPHTCLSEHSVYFLVLYFIIQIYICSCGLGVDMVTCKKRNTSFLCDIFPHTCLSEHSVPTFRCGYFILRQASGVL